MTYLPGQREVVRLVHRRAEEQRKNNLNQLRAAIENASEPLSTEIVAKLARLASWELANVMRVHKGFPLWERCKSYQTTLGVFEQAVDDLLAGVQNFEIASSDGDIFDTARQADLATVERRIQKELFAALSAVHALVDQARRVRDLAKVQYEHKRKHFFGGDGLHQFIVALRTAFHHSYV
jgi:hypothetical protein